jgi:hypothetical protein
MQDYLCLLRRFSQIGGRVYADVVQAVEHAELRIICIGKHKDQRLLLHGREIAPVSI